jgi:hypothetical protein
MTSKYLKVWGVLACLAVTAACGSSVMQPTSSTQPQLMSPGDGQQLIYAVQPLTLTAQNAVTTGSTPLTYTFQVASDAGFTNVVYSKAGVAQGTGQTSLTIGTLPGATTYYWRVQNFNGSVAGLSSKARSFLVGAQVILQAPTIPSSAASSIVGAAPTLTVTNVAKTGPAGPLTYHFEVADSADFSHIVFETSVAEQSSGQTSTQVTTKLPAATYYWRVQVTDVANGVTSPFSQAASFQVQLFNFSEATMVDAPNFASWAQTATITLIDFTPGNFFLVDFDKRDGPGRWPDVPFGTAGGSLEYSLGMCLNLSGHWFCSAPIQYWYGREIGASAYIARDWFYDGRWGPMVGHQPAAGEIVGIFVAAGNLRDRPAGDRSYVLERSNVQLIDWEGAGFFGSASTPSGPMRLLSGPARLLTAPHLRK